MRPVASEGDVKAALRSWVRERNPDLSPGDLDDHTPLIESRYLTSMEVTDLLLFIEETRRAPVDPASLRPGVFRTVESIYQAFFAGTSAP